MVEEFLNIIEGKKLIIHNAEFDIAHLNHELKLLGKDKIKNEVIDTLTLARDKFPGSSISLDSLCKKYRIDNSKRIQHTAFVDCDLLAKVYINLIDQTEPTLNFQDIKISLKELSHLHKKLEKSNIVREPLEAELESDNPKEIVKNCRLIFIAIETPHDK